jgi:hypothetical protein
MCNITIGCVGLTAQREALYTQARLCKKRSEMYGNVCEWVALAVLNFQFLLTEI